MSTVPAYYFKICRLFRTGLFAIPCGLIVIDRSPVLLIIGALNRKFDVINLAAEYPYAMPTLV